MIQFLKDAIREFKHVVWPTRKETQKYFSLVVAMLVFFGVYLFIASNIFSEILFGLKSVLGSDNASATSTSLSQEEIDALFSDEAQIQTTPVNSASGVTLSETGDEAAEIIVSGTGEVAQ